MNVSTSSLISRSVSPTPFASLAVRRMSTKSRWRFFNCEGSSSCQVKRTAVCMADLSTCAIACLLNYQTQCRSNIPFIYASIFIDPTGFYFWFSSKTVKLGGIYKSSHLRWFLFRNIYIQVNYLHVMKLRSNSNIDVNDIKIYHISPQAHCRPTAWRPNVVSTSINMRKMKFIH